MFLTIRNRTVVVEQIELIDGGSEVAFEAYWLDSGETIPDGLYYRIQSEYQIDLHQRAMEAA